MTYLSDPYAISCPYCRASKDRRCRTGAWRPAARPHKARVQLALVLAAHADPALDEHPFPGAGPCGICGTPGLTARHRSVDAIAGMLEAGEPAEVVADEHAVPVEAVLAVQAWAARWPGAWQ